MKKLLMIACYLFSVSCLAKQITIGMSSNLPPYVINKEQGIELDILTESLASQNVKVTFSFYRYTLLLKAMAKPSIDGVLLNGVSNTGAEVFQSDPILSFKNSAIAFKHSEFELTSVQDLVNKRVVSFKGATKVFGPEYSEAIKSTAAYMEHTDQSMLLKLFLGGRYNVVISDQRMFDYWLKRIKGQYTMTDMVQKIKYYPIFKPSARKIHFKDKQLRDVFNQGLKTIKDNGVYATIMTKYI